MTKAEEKRAAILAKQEEREIAERSAQAGGRWRRGRRAHRLREASKQLGGILWLRRTSPWASVDPPTNRKFQWRLRGAERGFSTIGGRNSGWASTVVRKLGGLGGLTVLDVQTNESRWLRS